MDTSSIKGVVKIFHNYLQLKFCENAIPRGNGQTIHHSALGEKTVKIGCYHYFQDIIRNKK